MLHYQGSVHIGHSSMNRSGLQCRAVAVVAVVAISSLAGRCTGDELQDKRMVTVRVQDIPTTVQLIGRLGKPLGSLLTIRGKWIKPKDNVKDNSLRFLVAFVGGKELSEKVEWNHAQIGAILSRPRGRGPKPGELWDWKFDWGGSNPPPAPADGDTWEILGVETGCFDWYSHEVAKEIALWTQQSAYYSSGFNTRIEYIAIRQLTTNP